MKQYLGKIRAYILLVVLTVSMVTAGISNVYVIAQTTSSDQTTKKLVDGLKGKTKTAQLTAAKKWQADAKAQLKAKGIDVDTLKPQQVDNSKIDVFVTFDGKAAVDKKSTPTADGSAQAISEIKDAEAKVVDNQSDILQKIEEITGQPVQDQFGYLVNGASIQATPKELAEIQSLKGVDQVQVSGSYKLLDTDANQLSQIGSVWQNRKLLGQGMAVAVIDSGVDYAHKDFKVSDPSKIKITKSEAEAKIKALGRGAWKSNKVPFAYNYADADSQDGAVKDSSNVMHGQHVAGIIAANGDNANNIDSVKGVAPEAQILDMKVFPNINSAVDTDVIIQAIQDAVYMGADVINMSLGRQAGSTDKSFGGAEVDAVEAAANAGVIPVISAGNSGVASSMDGFSTTSTFDNVDEGIIGDPSVASDSLSVASAENSRMVTTTYDLTLNLQKADSTKYDGQTSKHITGLDNLEYYGNESFKSSIKSSGFVVLPDMAVNTKDSAGYNIPVNPGMPGRGFEPDYTDAKGNKIDVRGKIVVISRGQNTFKEKQTTAKELGAKAIIIVNNKPGLDRQIGLSSVDIPTVELSPETWQTIKTQITDYGSNFYLNFENFHDSSVVNPDAGKISSFSSYGPTPSLDFKPEISGIGGNVWSTTNATGSDNGGYQNMSGTSMASPFVAGSMALLLESWKNNGVKLDGLAKVKAAKLSVINTSKPVFDDTNNSYYSPRQQGAGLIQVDNAIANTTTVKDENGSGTVTLKQIGASSTFDLTLTNNSSTKAAVYNFNDFGGVMHEQTSTTGTKYDQYLSGATITSSENTISIAPGQSKTVTISLNLDSTVTTNQFVEGFIGFTPADSESGLVDLTVPYVGFFGDYGDLPVFDSPAYDKNSDSDSKSVFNGQFFYDYETGIPLGLDLNYDELNALYQTGTLTSSSLEELAPYINPNHVAISPNGDDDWDSAVPTLYLMRNVTSLKIDIVDANGKVVRQLSRDNGWTKTWAAEGGSLVSYLTTKSMWDGTISDPKTGDRIVAPNGKYTYRVTATPDFPNAKPQTLDLSIIVDTETPEIKDVSVSKDADGKYYFTGSISDSLSGFSDLTYVGLAVNGTIAYYDVSDLTIADRIGAGDKTAPTTGQDLSNFKFELKSSQVTAIKNGTNDVQVSVMDNAHNVGTYRAAITVGDAHDMNNGLILYNVSNFDNDTSDSAYYDAKNKTYMINGYFPRDFYVSSDGQNFTKVSVDETGSFVTNVPIVDGTKKLYFTLDDNLNRPIQILSFGFTVAPTITIDNTKSGLDKDGIKILDYDSTSPITTLQGTVSADTEQIIAQTYNANANDDWVDVSNKVNFDKITHTWTLDVDAQEGATSVALYAIKKGGFDGKTQVASKKPAQAIIYQYASTYLRFNSVNDSNTVTVTADNKYYDSDQNTYDVTGKIDPQDAKNFVIFGWSQDPTDPRNMVDVQADGSFTYKLPLGLTQGVDGNFKNDTSQKFNDSKVKYQFDMKLSDGTWATNTGMFAIYSDTVFPTLNVTKGDSWKVSTQKDFDYEVTTNNPTFTVGGTATDNLDGYQLSINADSIFQQSGTDWDNTYIIANVGNTEFSHTFDLDTSKSETDNIFTLKLTDKTGNVTTKKILVHYAKLPAPVVTQAKIEDVKRLKDTDTYQVKLNFVDELNDEQKINTHIQYSTDGGKTWTEYTKTLELQALSTVLYRTYNDEGAVGLTKTLDLKPLVVPVTKVTASLKDAQLNVGQMQQIQTVVEPKTATDKTLKYSSSNSKVVTVDKNGVVRGVAPGVATITVTSQDGKVKDTFKVTVKGNVFTPKAGQLYDHVNANAVPFATKNNTYLVTLKYDVELSQKAQVVNHIEYSTDGGKSWLTYTKPVNVNGDVKFLYRAYNDYGKVGVIRTLKLNAFTVKTPEVLNPLGQSQVLSGKSAVALKQIFVNVSNSALSVGQTTQATSVLVPGNTTDTNIVYTSSTSEIIRVDSNGLVTAVASGVAQVIATSPDGKVSDKVTVTVKGGNFVRTNAQVSANSTLTNNVQQANNQAVENTLVPTNTNNVTTTDSAAVKAEKAKSSIFLLIADLIFILSFAILLVLYRKKKLVQTASLFMIGLVSFNLYQPIAVLASLKSTQVTTSQTLNNLQLDKKVGQMTTQSYDSTIVDNASQTQEVKDAAQNALNQFISTLSYGYTNVNGRPVSYSSLLTSAQVDSLVETMRQKLANATSASDV
ncbi:MAG: S8 family serine peptidase, partial [Lactobacillaceae bacterium]|nr:S8 family serine peptidase [Lactobacillaceae bacterium]